MCPISMPRIITPSGQNPLSHFPSPPSYQNTKDKKNFPSSVKKPLFPSQPLPLMSLYNGVLNFKIHIPCLNTLSIWVLVLSAVLPGCIHWEKTPNFYWPVKKPFYISRKFNIYHEGIDFPKKTGAEVRTIAKGRVVYAGSGFSGYGKMIIIKHSPVWSSLYAHLHSIHVKQGEILYRKQSIGKVGNTGRSSGSHLHFEILHKKQPINPLQVLPRL